jgi:hypothetical protein
MPIIVIVLMFLILFLLAVIAMILGPFLSLAYALWDLKRNQTQRERAADAQPIELKSDSISRTALSHR